MDTTKDVYRDDEAPAFQVQILNGERKEVPWNEVPEEGRYLFAYAEDRTFKYRVPIVEVRTNSIDEHGNKVPPDRGYHVDITQVGMNPKHTRHTYAGKAH